MSGIAVSGGVTRSRNAWVPSPNVHGSPAVATCQFPLLTLREHLELVRLTHEPVRGWCLPTDELIEVFGLPGRADAVPTDLSSGQRQRLSLAAALARPSRLLLLDEPEQSLDPGFREQLAGLLREYAGDAAGADLRGAGGHARDGPVIASAAAASPPRVAAIRSFIRRRRRRPWYDWYSTGFAVVLAVILLWDLLAQPFGRLNGPGSAGGAAPTQAVAGAALVIGSAAGLLVLAQALGPLALSLTRAGSVLLGLAAAWPTLRAVYAGHVHASTFGAQVAFAAVVLGGYLMIAVRSV